MDAINGVIEKIFAMVTLIPTSLLAPRFEQCRSLSPAHSEGYRTTSGKLAAESAASLANTLLRNGGVSAGRHLMFWPATPQRCKR